MSNPTRTCLACGGTDDHPRHVLDVGNGTTVNFHMDCHSIASGCEVCAAQIEDAKGAKGDKLRTHLLKTDATDEKAPGWTAPVIPVEEPETREAAA